MADSQTDWIELNQRYLTAALAEVRAALERLAERNADPATPSTEAEPASKESFPPEHQPALEVLSTTFRLTTFERGLLLLCAGMELESPFASLCAKAAGDPS